jgi:hypothetical protein
MVIVFDYKVRGFDWEYSFTPGNLLICSKDFSGSAYNLTDLSIIDLPSAGPQLLP